MHNPRPGAALDWPLAAYYGYSYATSQNQNLSGNQCDEYKSVGSGADTTCNDIVSEISESEPDPSDFDEFEIALQRQFVEQNLYIWSIIAYDANFRTETLKTGYRSVVIVEKDMKVIETLLALFRLRGIVAAQPLLDELQGRGALFYGPPGTGKTHICRAVVKESGMSALAIDAATIYRKYVGETEKSIRATSSLKRKAHPCILFIDEVDAIFAYRVRPRALGTCLRNPGSERKG